MQPFHICKSISLLQENILLLEKLSVRLVIFKLFSFEWYCSN